MISTFRFLVVPLLAGALLAAGCTSSGGGGLSEDEAAERVDAVIETFEAAADDEGFSEDEEDDEDDSDFECDGFEDFGNDDDDSVAEAELEVTDGREAEVTGVEADTIIFEGGEVSGGIKLGVAENDRLRDSLDAVLDDIDGFEECVESAFQDSLANQDNSSLEGAEFDVDVDVDEGDTGDQEVVIGVDGLLSGSSEGLNFELPLKGELRLIRIARAGLMTSALTIGDVDADSIQPAIDAAVEEFETQFGS